jgi:5-hydroxyisourate hydrolase
MSGITSHVLDTSRGAPAANIEVQLECKDGDLWRSVGGGTTNDDGRVPDLMTTPLAKGHYRINFLVADYFAAFNQPTFYPIVRIEFYVDDAAEHYHVPLLLNPFGYSTYRGS